MQYGIVVFGWHFVCDEINIPTLYEWTGGIEKSAELGGGEVKGSYEVVGSLFTSKD